MEIRPDVTDVFKLSHAKRDLFIVVLPGNQQGGQQKTVLTWSIWGHGVFGAQTVSFSMHRSRSIRWPVQCVKQCLISDAMAILYTKAQSPYITQKHQQIQRLRKKGYVTMKKFLSQQVLMLAQKVFNRISLWQMSEYHIIVIFGSERSF